MDTQLMHTEFPTTGQPIRVVMIDGEPWFVVMDVCRILGYRNPRQAATMVKGRTRHVNVHTIRVSEADANHDSPGGNASKRGNPILNVVNEGGLYKLIMRSNKPTAQPFQDWITDELLPSIRRGDTDLGAARERMAETFAEALDLGRPVVGDRRIDVDDQPFEVRNDGSVHCPHGRMRLIAPLTEDEPEPPFGPYFRCTDVERVGIRRHRAHRPCRQLLVTSVVRHLLARTQPPAPEVDVMVTLGSAQLHGKPGHIAEVLHRLGMNAPAY